MRWNGWLCVVVALSAVSAAECQPWSEGALERAPFEPAPVERILRQSAVDALLEDRDGFLWIGTREGLVRWDGRRARHWTAVPFDDASLPHPVVHSLAQDADGHLWVVTSETIYGPRRAARLVAPDLDRFVRYDPGGVDLALDGAGRPWLVDDETIWRYRPDDDRFEPWMERPRRRQVDRQITMASFASDGALWLIDALGVDRCLVEERMCLEARRPTERLALKLLPDVDRMRIPGDDRLLCRAVGPEGTSTDTSLRLVPCPDLPLELPGPPTALLREGEGDLWIATLDGVVRVGRSGRARTVPIRTESGAASRDVYTLVEDRAGGVWAGTPWGLLRSEPARRFEHFTVGDVPDRSPPVLSLHEDARGTLWVGTIGDGLHARRADGSWWHFDDAALGQPADAEAKFVWAIASRDDELWLGTSTGLARLDLARVDEAVPVRVESVASFGLGVRALAFDAEGTLWIGTYVDGVFSYAEGRLAKRYDEPGFSIETMLLRPDGRIWLATSEDGLRLVDPETGTARALRHDPADPRSLAAPGVVSLHRDDETGTLWVGTTRGLDRLVDEKVDDEFHGAVDEMPGTFEHGTFEHRTFEHVLGPDDLPSGSVLAILGGPRRLWLSTNRGLVSVDRDDPSKVSLWGLDDGVGNLELNRGAAMRDRAGRLLVGGDRGVTRFLPAAVRPSSYRPPIRLDRLVATSRRGRRIVEPVDGRIVLGPEVTSFTVELATIDFSWPARNRFALRMTDVESGWIELGTRRAATYAGVPPGEHRLQARVANVDGVWSDETLDLALVVVPPIWRTPLFQAAAGLVAVLLVLASGALLARRRYRLRYRRRLERLEAERRREQDRRRISRDLHDDLGAGLTQLVLLGERGALEGDRPGRELGARVAADARRMIDAIREIVWSIDPTEDRLDRLAARLRANAADLLESAGLRARFELPTTLPELAVSPQLRRNLSLILREALHNVVRHAQAESVLVRLSVDHEGLERDALETDALKTDALKTDALETDTTGRTLRLEIVDDGRGMERSDDGAHSSAGGRGIGHLKARAAEIGGATTFESRLGAGTRVRVVVPLVEDRGSTRG